VILQSIEGRKNHPRKDPFEGGGKIYPEIHGEILERYESRDTLLIQIDNEIPWEVTNEKEEILTYKKVKENRIPVKRLRVAHESNFVKEEQVKELIDVLKPIDEEGIVEGETK